MPQFGLELCNFTLLGEPTALLAVRPSIDDLVTEAAEVNQDWKHCSRKSASFVWVIAVFNRPQVITIVVTQAIKRLPRE